MDIEAAKFRVMLDELFHAMPIGDTIEVTTYVREKLAELSMLTYADGKQSVINARRIVALDKG